MNDGTRVAGTPRVGLWRRLAGGVLLLAGAGTAWADVDPPAPVTDLSIDSAVRARELHVVLRWSAPEDIDRGMTGRPASSYDIRYSTAPIQSVADFDAARRLTSQRTAGNTIPTPALPGTTQSVEVVGLKPGTTYYFALKSIDASGNASNLSNLPSRATAKYEGYASGAAGGGDGDVCRVVSLADAGSGSLRSCLFPAGGRSCSSQPLTVVFDVGGSITLLSDILIDANDCNLTIDGSTAPAPGITIRKQACPPNLTSCPLGNACLQAGEFKIGADQDIATANVIVAYLRFRGNYQLQWGPCTENSGASLGLQYHFTDVVLDHLTIRGGEDSAPDIWTGTRQAARISISHALLAWSNHPLTISDSGGQGSRDDLSVHHNVIARSGERMPQVRYKTTDLDFRNNVVFDWGANGSGSYAMRIPNDDGQAGPRRVSANVVNNVFLAGGGNPRNAFYYGTGPGSQASPTDGDGGPSACTTSDGCTNCPAQGTVVSGSYMGELWVSGNEFPSQVCEKWSSVSSERPVPVSARVTTHASASLVDTVLPSAGTRFREADEQALMDEIAALMGGSGSLCGNDILEPGEPCDGTEFGGMTCADFGFESGQLACTAECVVATSGCLMVRPSAVENLRRSDKR